MRAALVDDVEQHELPSCGGPLGHDRFGLQLSVGTLPHDKVMKAIELFGTVVKPAVNKALGSKVTLPAGSLH